MDEGVCRICGATVATWELLDAQRGGGCIRCDGSPLCSRCGHPRKQHLGVFSSAGRTGCRAEVPVPDTLGMGRCGCIGYVAARGPFGQATFATEEAPLVDVVIPKLRITPPEGSL